MIGVPVAVFAVVPFGLALLAAVTAWPPQVVVETDTIEPNVHAGFVTKGANAQTSTSYDQVRDGFTPVEPEWIAGKAEARVP